MSSVDRSDASLSEAVLPRAQPAASLPAAPNPVLPASLRDAAAPLPFVATAARPQPGDTVDLATVLAAQADAVDLSRVQMALGQVLASLRPADGGIVDRRVALATLRETRLTAADLPLPPGAK